MKTYKLFVAILLMFLSFSTNGVNMNKETVPFLDGIDTLIDRMPISKEDVEIFLRRKFEDPERFELRKCTIYPLPPLTLFDKELDIVDYRIFDNGERLFRFFIKSPLRGCVKPSDVFERHPEAKLIVPQRPDPNDFYDYYEKNYPWGSVVFCIYKVQKCLTGILFKMNSTTN